MMTIVRALLIDDELSEQSSKVKLLREYGIEVTVVNRAAEVPRALQAVRGRVDAVLLDIMMPPDGYGSMESSEGGRFTGALILKDVQTALPGVPVIVVSAHNEAEARERLGPGVSLFLEKPVSAMEVARQVKAVLKG